MPVSYTHLDVWIKNIMDLYIDEQEIVMNNISTYLTGFQSSSDNVEIQNLKVFVEGVETSTAGVSVTREPFVHNGSITVSYTHLVLAIAHAAVAVQPHLGAIGQHKVLLFPAAHRFYHIGQTGQFKAVVNPQVPQIQR